MAYLWNSSLETGFIKVDLQHRQLLKALNNIADSFREGKGTNEIYKTLDFLAKYTVIHFAVEEKLMKMYNYHDYSCHKKCHEDFKATVKELIQKLHNESPTEELIVNVTTIIGDWLISHIRVDDIRMGSFVKSRIRLIKNSENKK